MAIQDAVVQGIGRVFHYHQVAQGDTVGEGEAWVRAVVGIKPPTGRWIWRDTDNSLWLFNGTTQTYSIGPARLGDYIVVAIWGVVGVMSSAEFTATFS